MLPKMLGLARRCPALRRRLFPLPRLPHGKNLLCSLSHACLGNIRKADRRGKSTDSSLPLFNLTRQAALGTFQSIFKLTIYNHFLKKTDKDWGSQASPTLWWRVRSWGLGDDNTAACCQVCQQVR